MNGTNLLDAYKLAMEAAAARGLLKLGTLERRNVLIWTPLDRFATPC